MKRISCIVIILAAFLCLTANNTRAAEEKKAAPAPAAAAATPTAASAEAKAKIEKAPTPAEMKEMTKEEMVARLKEMCQYHPDMLSAIPGLTVKEVNGKKIYEYKGKPLDELDKDTVHNLFMAANRFISFQNTQRFQQQMKNLKQIDDMNKLQRSLKQTQTPNVPKTYTPPKTYKAPGK